MRQEPRQQIRHALEQLGAAAAPYDPPTAAQVWQRLQFRLAYRARKSSYPSHGSALVTALYVLVFLIWTNWSGWLSAGLLAVLAFATVAAVFLLLLASRGLRN